MCDTALNVLFSWDGHWISVLMKMNVEMHHVTMNKIVSIQQDLTNVFKKESVKILSWLDGLTCVTNGGPWYSETCLIPRLKFSRWISRNFMILVFNLSSRFLGKIPEWIIRMKFRDFPKNGFSDYGESVKFQEFPLVIVLRYSLKNDNLGLKMKILKLLGIQPIYTNFWLKKAQFGKPDFAEFEETARSDKTHLYYQSNVACNFPASTQCGVNS